MVFLVVLVLAAAAAEEGFFYHEAVGVPLAAHIRATEVAGDGLTLRIAGGNAARLSSHPHLGGVIATLTDGRSSFCSSSLLSNTRALTAAHCWWDGVNQAKQFEVVFGSLTLYTGGVRINTTSVFTHSNYSRNLFQNDIAIIYLNWVNYTNVIQPITLPVHQVNNQFVGSWAWAAGFGRIADDKTFPKSLREVRLRVIDNADCAIYKDDMNEDKICVSGSGGKSICKGDSGGALWIWNGKQRMLIGVSCIVNTNGCQIGKPTGFVRVTSYIPWIQSHL